MALPLDEPVPCHNDLLAGNLIAAAPSRAARCSSTGSTPGWATGCFDLGNLAVNNDFDDGAEERLLTAYFGEPPTTAGAPR